MSVASQPQPQRDYGYHPRFHDAYRKQPPPEEKEEVKKEEPVAEGGDQEEEEELGGKGVLDKQLEKLSRNYDVETMKVFMVVEALGESSLHAIYNPERKANWTSFLWRQEACRLDLAKHDKTRERYNIFMNEVGKEEQSRQWFLAVLRTCHRLGATDVFHYICEHDKRDPSHRHHLPKRYDPQQHFYHRATYRRRLADLVPHETEHHEHRHDRHAPHVQNAERVTRILVDPHRGPQVVSARQTGFPGGGRTGIPGAAENGKHGGGHGLHGYHHHHGNRGHGSTSHDHHGSSHHGSSHHGSNHHHGSSHDHHHGHHHHHGEDHEERVHAFPPEKGAAFCEHLARLFESKLNAWFEDFQAVAVKLTAHVKVSGLVRVLSGKVHALVQRQGRLHAMVIKVTAQSTPRPLDVAELCLTKVMVIQNGLALPEDLGLLLLCLHVSPTRPVLRLWSLQPSERMEAAVRLADIDEMIDAGRLSEQHELWTDNTTTELSAGEMRSGQSSAGGGGGRGGSLTNRNVLKETAPASSFGGNVTEEEKAAAEKKAWEESPRMKRRVPLDVLLKQQEKNVTDF